MSLRTLLFPACLLTAAAPLLAVEIASTSGTLIHRGDSNAASTFVGEVVATGDFDNDGYDDLVVGAPHATVGGFANAGMVLLYRGGPTGLPDEPTRTMIQNGTDPSNECNRPEEGDRFGSALAVGDFNGDGFDDLAIGAPGEDVLVAGVLYEASGTVDVYFGRANQTFWVTPCLVYGQSGLPGDPDDGSAFGSALAVGDFDADFRDDLAVGAPGARSLSGVFGAGSVTILPGRSVIGFDPADATYWDLSVDGVPGNPDSNGRFGAALATGDLVLGQQIACDLVVGAPGHRPDVNTLNAGMTTVLFGCTESGLTTDGSLQWSAPDFGRAHQAGGELGSSLAVGQFDCDGGLDIALGAPGRNVAATQDGEVFLISGDLANSPTFSTLSRLEISGTSANFIRFGQALLPVPDTLCSHLLIGEPGRFLDPAVNGRLYLARAGAASPIVLEYSIASAHPQAAFGWSLTTGSFDGRSQQVVVGAPSATIAATPQAGGVWAAPLRFDIFADGFEKGTLEAWSASVGF
jgi:hypothetical protein